MDKTDGSGDRAPLGLVLTGLMAALAAIKQEDFLSPMALGEQDGIHHKVGDATDAIKRLVTYRAQLIDAHNKAAEKMNSDFNASLENLRKQPGTTMEDVLQFWAAERYSIALEASRAEIDWLWMLCQKEVGATFPEMVGKPGYYIDSDWSVGWLEPSKKEEECTNVRGHGFVVGIAMGEEFSIGEFLRGVGRSHFKPN